MAGLSTPLYDGRLPEIPLEEGARRANSAWSFVPKATAAGHVEHLHRDLADGNWDRRYAVLRTQPEFDGSLRLVVSKT
jgi:hypothetical protein